MRTKNTILSILLLLAMPSLAAFSGSLSAQDGGLLGTGFWITDNGQTGWFPAGISWSVTPVGNLWHYEYMLTVFRDDVSHLLLETSLTFGPSNIVNAVYPGQSTEINTFTQSNGNPFMPGSLHGIKFDATQGTTISIGFDSDRDPVWGDFYAKCGAVGGTQNTVWNAGFMAADPMDAPSNGSNMGHLLVPDTIPEPATILLLAIGLMVTRRRV